MPSRKPSVSQCPKCENTASTAPIKVPATDLRAILDAHADLVRLWHLWQWNGRGSSPCAGVKRSHEGSGELVAQLERVPSSPEENRELLSRRVAYSVPCSSFCRSPFTFRNVALISFTEHRWPPLGHPALLLHAARSSWPVSSGLVQDGQTFDEELNVIDVGGLVGSMALYGALTVCEARDSSMRSPCSPLGRRSCWWPSSCWPWSSRTPSSSLPACPGLFGKARPLRPWARLRRTPSPRWLSFGAPRAHPLAATHRGAVRGFVGAPDRGGVDDRRSGHSRSKTAGS